MSRNGMTPSHRACAHRSASDPHPSSAALLPSFFLFVARCGRRSVPRIRASSAAPRPCLPWLRPMTWRWQPAGLPEVLAAPGGGRPTASAATGIPESLPKTPARRSPNDGLCSGHRIVGSVPRTKKSRVDHRALFDLAVAVDHRHAVAPARRQLPRHPADIDADDVGRTARTNRPCRRGSRVS